MPLLPLCAFLILARPAGPFEDAIGKITGPDALSITFVNRTMTGAKAEWALAMQRPNRLRAESADQLILCDGSRIGVLDKKTGDVALSEFTEANQVKLLSRPDLFLARAFFQRNASWISNSTDAGKRIREGVTLSGSKVSPDELETATLYVTPGDSIAFVVVDTGAGSTRTTNILDKVLISPAKYPDNLFALNFVARPSKESPAPISEAALREAANGYLSYRPLAWDQFRVSDSEGQFQANTIAYIRYSFKSKYAISGSGYTASVTAMEIRSGFDQNRSWRKSSFIADGDNLLRHEQGHLDINETYARQLRKLALGDWPVGTGASDKEAENNLEQRLRARVDEALAAAGAEQLQYDDETQHGRVESAQTAWLAKIKRDLDATK